MQRVIFNLDEDAARRLRRLATLAGEKPEQCAERVLANALMADIEQMERLVRLRRAREQRA